MGSDSGIGSAARDAARDEARGTDRQNLRSALIDLGSLSLLAVAAVAWLWWGSPEPTERASATGHLAAAAETTELRPEPVPEPEPTQLAEAPVEAPEVARVASTTGVNARPCPDAADTCPPIVALPYGSEVQVLALNEGDGSWARVRSRDIGGRDGFVVMRALAFPTPRG